jgi:uncharacterized protein (UPF0548 family)
MLMLTSKGRVADFDPARWTSRHTNLPSGTERVGSHDDYSIALPLRPGELRSTERQRALESLFHYRIFPEHRMRAEICTVDGRIVDGTTIIQRVFMGSLCLEMAVRVTEVFGVESQSGKTGFTYATLVGHVERGLATFSVDDDSDETLTFRIESWSSPGNLLARLGRPIARRMQRSSTDQALRNFRDHFREP